MRGGAFRYEEERRSGGDSSVACGIRCDKRKREFAVVVVPHEKIEVVVAT